MGRFDDIEIFENKKLSDLFSEVYSRSDLTKTRIEGLIDQIKPLIVDIDSALIMVPLIKDYLESGIKNNDLLNKLGVNIVRMLTANREDAGDSEWSLPDEFKEQLEKLASEEEEISNETKEFMDDAVEWKERMNAENKNDKS